jgi:hypothetical protein
MEINGCTLEVRVHGRDVREYQHEGEVWVEGRAGSDFTLRIKNSRSTRVLAVLAVDGLDVMTGKDATRDAGGYVVPAFGHLDIPGWRLNDNDVAKFVFAKPGESYAAKTGRPGNIGIVGCAIFDEKFVPPPPVIKTIVHHHYPHNPWPWGHWTNEVYGSSHQVTSQGVDPIQDNAVFCNATMDSAPVEMKTSGGILRSASLGTGFGQQTEHRVRTVNFEKASETPSAELVIRYGSKDDLKNRGIELDRRPVVAQRPTAFPGDRGCAPPPGWSGK